MFLGAATRQRDRENKMEDRELETALLKVNENVLVKE